MTRQVQRLVHERSGAPALEKGLDVLETLAAGPTEIGQKELAALVGRSVSEIFRVLGVLERRGYIARDATHRHYSLTMKLFELARRHDPTQRLRLAARPIMQELTDRVGQSLHLGVVDSGSILMVAETEPNGLMVFLLRPGARCAISERYITSRILAAFAREPTRSTMLRAMAVRPLTSSEPALRRQLDEIALAGYQVAPSVAAPGIINIGFPVFDHDGQVKASLVMPVLPHNARHEMREMVPLVGAAARRISIAIGAPSAIPTRLATVGR